MNNVVVLLIALLVGMAIGAATFAVVTREEPELRKPGMERAAEDSAEITRLRAENEQLRAKLQEYSPQPDSPAEPAAE